MDSAQGPGSSGNGSWGSWESVFSNTLLWVLRKGDGVDGIELLCRGHVFWGKVLRTVHDEGAELTKEGALERFCEEVRDHVFGGAVSHFDPSLFDLVCDIEVFDV